MSAKKDKDSPATTSAAWDEMIPTWEMIETLLEGTEAMRAAGTTYLPPHEGESDPNYHDRLNGAVLFNMTELTLDTLVGRPFSDPVRPKDVPSRITTLLDNVDLQGNNLDTFCRLWFREGMAKAFAHVLVDAPDISEEGGNQRTLETDRRENRRPYWVLVKPENLIFAHAENVDGQEVLTHLRIREVVSVQDGFAEVFTERIRVLEPGSFQIWERTKSKRKKEEWRITRRGETGLDVIPLVTFYANRKGLMLGKSPLEDLAHMNIRHWQSSSDQNNVLTVARFPILAVSGAHDPSGSMLIGPRQILGTKDPQGRFYYVEHEGNAIEAGRRDLLDLEEAMGSYGAEFLRRKPGNPTATARALDSSEATSPLQDHTHRFTDAVNKAMGLTALWLNLDGGGEVEISTDFGPEVLEAADLETLHASWRDGALTTVDYLTELKRRGMLADDFEVTDDKVARAAAEAATRAQAMRPEPVRPTEPDDDDEDEDRDG